jgi:acetoin utilization protein AcuB
MSKAPRTIDRYMTTVLHVARPQDSVADVASRMRQHGMRHMPIVEGKIVRGVVSLRDLQVVEVLRDVDPTELAVAEVMAREPYMVEPEDDVARVALHMAEARLGSAVVAHGNELRGLFTATDALLALAAVLHAEDVPESP